ncbi:MAG: acyl transferase [Lewinellaceae bacterium]|nr:acyl transferase [Lewinellaceae bacterium]
MQTVDRQDLLSKIADLTPENFGAVALEVFRFQATGNKVYARFLELLGKKPATVRDTLEIPFLPISLFKSYSIQTGNWDVQTVFTSSATTGQTPSKHRVRDLTAYLANTRLGFCSAYSDPSEWCTLALLPSYLERSGSSLVAMADYFIRLSPYAQSGFFLNDLNALQATLFECIEKEIPTLLLGVSFALLDFAEQYPMDLSGITIMETGGMKGRREELTRSALHRILCEAFNVPGIHSEYGMTELFSQAYSQPRVGMDSRFVPGPLLQAVAREINDPFAPVSYGRSGVLQFIDLANLDTCSFLATEDIGKVYPDGTFEVLGRLDAAELRGCNLMVE